MAADALLSVGDVRGEFMALSLKKHDQRGSLSALSQKKLIKLFKRLRTDWLGALAPVVSWERLHDHREGGGPTFRIDVPCDGYEPAMQNAEIWEHSFPVRLVCRLTGSSTGAREWLTVREVHLAPAENAMPTELTHAVTRHLRRVHLTDSGGSQWPEQIREYLRSIGREALLDTPSEWRGAEFYL